MNSKAQGSISYLLLVGGAVLMASIALFIIYGTGESGKDFTEQGKFLFQNRIKDLEDLVTGCGNGTCETGEDCPQDCCEEDCTFAFEDEICHSSCNGLNGCNLTAPDMAILGQNICLDSTSWVNACKGPPTLCTESYCENGACNACDSGCDGSCPSSACINDDDCTETECCGNDNCGEGEDNSICPKDCGSDCSPNCGLGGTCTYDWDCLSNNCTGGACESCSTGNCPEDKYCDLDGGNCEECDNLCDGDCDFPECLNDYDCASIPCCGNDICESESGETSEGCPGDCPSEPPEECIGEGEIKPNEPGTLDCCELLVEIYDFGEVTEQSNCEILPEQTKICSDCGNGSCEEWENRCNCLEDCESGEPDTTPPGEPTGCGAENQSSTTALVSWANPSDEDFMGTKVYYCLESECDLETPENNTELCNNPNIPGSADSCPVLGFIPLRKYHYWIMPYDDATPPNYSSVEISSVADCQNDCTTFTDPGTCNELQCEGYTECNPAPESHEKTVGSKYCTTDQKYAVYDACEGYEECYWPCRIMGGEVMCAHI